MERMFIYFFIAAFGLLALWMLISACYAVARHIADAYLKFTGTRVVVCPETRQHVAVEVDARHAAATAAYGQPQLKLHQCTRWPERADCDQDCIWQIERAPEDCLVRKMLTDWYAEKACALCARPIGEIHWADHKPALMSLEHRAVRWSDVAPEKLPDVLTTHLPLCWNCYIVETFRNEHPDLVVERHR